MEEWGTWEELVLGGAVMRYGTQDWSIVALELQTQTRIVSPFTLTPEVCKAKYEELRKRYSGCPAWFEELRKERVAELRRALELSDGAIGSLEAKLESLKAEKSEKGDDCGINAIETSAKESDLSGHVCPISNCGEVVKSSGVIEEGNRNLRNGGIKDLMGILDSVLLVKGASTFGRKLDIQKRGRYKKMIRRHMDLDTIRSRIKNQKIKSMMELFRDLLLLTNNALVFNSKKTRRYKTALLLRDHVMKTLKEKRCFSSSATNANASSTLPVHVSPGAKKDSSPSVELPIKKAFGKPKNVGHEGAAGKNAKPMREKKSGRTK
ncbi:hypothetical protein RJT34_04353 [Clitoria ternatea]|uniref:Bromo domain-containing protein n=1 Tax=Clitoria ternatea TaxID=43366 RepID=A0AAN9KKT0_CLITE